MPYFVPLWTSLEHLCITLYTYRIYYSTVSSLYFICNGFSHFYYLLSQLFLFFKFYFLLYIYILWFYILLSLRCFGSAFLYMAVFFSFLSHFWCGNLFLVQIIPFSQPNYISVYRLLFYLKILRCLCVETSWFATITFPVSAYIASLCAKTSMLVDPQHQYIVFLKQFLKGGFYTGKTSYNTLHLCLHVLPQRSLVATKGGFYTREKWNSCFTSPLLLCLLP